MFYADVIKLISENPSAHGAFEQVEETSRTVFCEVKSVTRSEYYLAASAGLAPEFVFGLSDIAEYNGEKLCEFKGERYKVVRSYRNGDAIELTVQREGIE